MGKTLDQMLEGTESMGDFNGIWTDEGMSQSNACLGIFLEAAQLAGHERCPVSG